MLWVGSYLCGGPVKEKTAMMCQNRHLQISQKSPVNDLDIDIKKQQYQLAFPYGRLGYHVSDNPFDMNSGRIQEGNPSIGYIS